MAVLAGGALLLYGALTLHCSDSWNDLSRMAAIQSLVERNDWRIAPSDFTPLTFDKVFIKGHYYSDKTPTLTWFAAGAYVVLRNGFGVELRPCTTTDVPTGYYWLTVLFMNTTAVALLIVFLVTLRQLGLGWWSALGLTLLLAVGTEIFAYSLVFNHHLPSAAAVFGSLAVMIHIRRHAAPHRRLWLIVGGGLAGLAATFDLLAGIVVAGLFVMALIRFRRDALYFALGAVLPVALMLILDYQMIENLLPPYMYPNAYKYPGSRLANTVAGNRPSDTPGLYAFQMLVGNHGLLAYSPILLLGLAGVVAVIRNRQHPLWMEACVTAASAIGLIGYLVTNTYNFGGTAYGQRWLLVLVPNLMLFGAFALPSAGLKGRARVRWGATVLLLVAAAGLSLGSAFQGALRPWHFTQPPLYLTYNPEEPPFVGMEFSWK
jgi:hypothetical protein